MSVAGSAQPQWPKVGLRGVIVFAAIFMTGSIGFLLPKFGADFILPLLPSGIAMAARYRWGPRMWPFVFASVAAVDWAHEQILIEALAVGGGLAGGTALTAWLLEHYRFDAAFAHVRDVALFILASAAGMSLMPTLGFIGLALVGRHTDFSLERWIDWWSNMLAGVLVVAPVLISMSRHSLVSLSERSWIALGLWSTGIAGCCAAILLVPTSGPIVRAPLLVLEILLIVVGAMRFDLVMTAGAALAISMTTALSVDFNLGVFSQLGKLPGLTVVWSVIAALTGLSLIITALLAERDAQSSARLRAEHRYAEIFEGSPQPVWVHSRDTGRFLLVNAAAMRQYGWNQQEFLMRSVADLAAPGQLHVLPEPGEEGTGELAGQFRDTAIAPATDPFETRHRTRGGRVLDVEVWTRAIDLAGYPATLVFAIDVTERRTFGRALAEAIASEQHRIGQEMHDGLGQELTGLSLSVQALANRAQREWADRAADLEQLAAMVARCIKGARLIVQGLSPLSDADDSLEAALEALARRSSLSGTSVRFQARLQAPLSIALDVRSHLFRIAQESVQNALKHAGGTVVEIELSCNAERVQLSIIDNGRGLAPDAQLGKGLGMRTMRFRARSIGGRLFIGLGENGGSRVYCDVPQAVSVEESNR
ncbi:MAG: PAS domain S-box protein [Steroidobacteraceae bacterium]|nr:PAS domain S-box protein [Steroidobacteraceae bacterium]